MAWLQPPFPIPLHGSEGESRRTRSEADLGKEVGRGKMFLILLLITLTYSVINWQYINCFSKSIFFFFFACNGNWWVTPCHWHKSFLCLILCPPSCWEGALSAWASTWWSAKVNPPQCEISLLHSEIRCLVLKQGKRSCGISRSFRLLCRNAPRVLLFKVCTIFIYTVMDSLSLQLCSLPLEGVIFKSSLFKGAGMPQAKYICRKITFL